MIRNIAFRSDVLGDAVECYDCYMLNGLNSPNEVVKYMLKGLTYDGTAFDTSIDQADFSDYDDTEEEPESPTYLMIQTLLTELIEHFKKLGINKFEIQEIKFLSTDRNTAVFKIEVLE